YARELSRMLGPLRPAAWLARPLVRAWMLARSPHWRERHPPVARPHPAWWALVMAGMALTTVLAVWPAAHALAFGALESLLALPVARVLSLPVVRAIFAVAVLLHLSESLAAARLAWRSPERANALPWALQTLLLGWPSLRLLLARLRPGKLGVTAP
ncbi:MAG TPA: DUF4499 domain-containing protein, partial [Deinococcales bacterium]|nr:DUF4499 domain-containing protein [Deinococcales bacterium]